MNKEKVTRKKEKVTRVVTLLFILAFLLSPLAALWADERGQAKPAAVAPGEAKPSPTVPAHDFVYLGDARPVLYRLHLEIDGRTVQTAWWEFIDQAFKSLDANGDGILNEEEARRVPPAPMLAAVNQLNVTVPPPFSLLDQDGDGKVTRDELARYYQRFGVAPFQIQVSQGQFNQNAVVFSPDGRRVSTQGGDVLTERLFALLDTDKDGKLSAAELLAAPRQLLKLDADDDGTVASAELVGSVRTSQYSAPVQTLTMGSVQQPPANFLAITPGQTQATLAQQLLARYADKEQKEGSRNPSRASIKLDEVSFALLDRDGNGRLDAEELARFAERPADVELIVRLGKVAAGKPAVEVVSQGGAGALSASLTSKSNGATLDLGTTRLDLTTVSGAGQDLGFNASIKQTYQRQFATADQDKNGYLDRNEANRSGTFTTGFKVMDRDGDGKLFEKEMMEYLEQIEVLQTKAMAGCCSLSITDQGKGLFDLLDTSRDGRLSLREMRNAVRQLDHLDRDGDKNLGKDEIPRSYVLAMQRGATNPGQNRNRVVLSASGNMMGNPRPAQGTAGPLWFRKMDRNRDGDVSRREFPGTDEEFQRLDRDEDGLISVEEAERAK